MSLRADRYVIQPPPAEKLNEDLMNSLASAGDARYKRAQDSVETCSNTKPMKRSLQTIAGITRVTCIAGLLLTLTMHARAQEANAPEMTKPMIVTGSLIPTAETVTAVPVDVITAETIERLPARTVDEIIRRQPSAVGAGNFGLSRGNGGNGMASIALRGIPGGTLLLVNGRRMATYDVNAIPMGAIDRVEILKDGGSSLYGADAVAGVVNVILKKDYSGMEVNAQYGNTTDTDVGEQRYDFVTGSTSEKTSVLVGGSYYKVNALYSRDRERSRPDLTPGSDGYYLNTSGTGNPGRIGNGQLGTTSSGVFYTGAPGTTPTSPADFRDFNPDTDRFPYPMYTPATRDAERYSLFANAEHSIFGENLKFFTEGFYTYSWNYNQLAPTPITSGSTGLRVPANNAFNVFGTEIRNWNYRPDELGPRTDENQFDIYRFVGGFKGQIADSTWHWEAAALYARQDGVNTQGNDISRNGLATALASTDPATAFNIFGNRANSVGSLNLIRLDHYTFDLDELFMVDAKVYGDVYELPGGPIQVLVGGEHREEKSTHRPDASLVFDDVVGFNGDRAYQGSREVNAAVYEVKLPVFGKDMHVPVLETLELSHSGRYEDYSDFGSQYVPKVSLLWQPLANKSLALRASYSESFTAPGFGDLYAGLQESYPELINPVKQAAGNPEYRDQIRTYYQGNAALQPATAKNITASLIYTPPNIKTLTLGVDWFKVEQEDVVGSVDQYIIDANYAGGGPANPAAPYANLIQFNPATSEYERLDALTLNLSKRIIEGLDFTVNWDYATEKYGSFNWFTAVTYYYRFEQANLPGDPLSDRLGDFVDPSQGFGLGSLPRLKGYSSIFWRYEGFEFGPTLNYIHSYRDDPQFAAREVSAQYTIDLQASYRLDNSKYEWLNNTKLTVGCVNVMDKEPPYVAGAFADNYDRDTHDLRGRFVYVRLNKTF